MNKYIAHFVQRDKGCDYTIGCGLRWQAFYAENDDEVLFDVKEYVKEYFKNPEDILSKCSIYEICSEVDVDLEEWYKDLKEEQESKEYAEYLKLKAKFENGN